MDLERSEVYILDPDYRVLRANESACSNSGYPAEELLGQDFRRMFSGESALSADDVATVHKGRMHRRDGSTHPVTLRLQGAADQILAVVESRLGEERADQRFQRIFESAPNGFILVDEQGKLIMVNRMTELLFGYNRLELLGQSVELLVPGEVRDRHTQHRDQFHQHPRTRAMGANMHLTALRKDGSQFPVEIGLTPVPTAEGLFVVGSIVDLTERRRAEAELQRYREHLEEMVREQTELLQQELREKSVLEERQRLGRELHDSVSQALYGIGLGVRTALVQLDRDPERAREPLDYVLSLTESGLTEMRALLFKLRPQSLENVSLREALKNQLAALRIRYEIDAEIHCPAEDDEPGLHLELKHTVFRIALEAMNNAVKHAEPQRLVLNLDFEDGHVLLEVRDDGKGFDPGASFPGHHGLASMRERAERLDGELSIDSRPGHGTVVTAHLPLQGLTPEPE